MDQQFDIKTYVNIISRRYLYLILPIVPIFALACTVAYLIPSVYHASAKILVQSQQIPTELARPTVMTSAAQQISVMRQRLMTRANLLSIIRKYDLYPAKRKTASLSDLVQRIRDAAVIEHIVAGPRRSQQAIAFSVAFEYSDPKLASAVANEFVALILEWNIKSRTERAAETHKFFIKQIEQLEKQIAAQEALIVQFKNENAGTLPDTLGYRRVLHTRLQTQYSEIDRQLVTQKAERERLANSEDGTATVEDLNASEAQLAQLRLQLTQLLAVYSERHPSVRKTKRRIEALEKVSAEENETKAKAAADPSSQVVKVNSRASIQVAAIDRKINDLLAERTELRKTITNIEQTIAHTPQVEIALSKLTRQHELLQFQQRTAQAKASQAATGELLEESRQAERFEVIERATTPSRPAKPNRPLLVLAGFFASIATGVGLVFLVELLDSSIHSATDLERRLNTRPLATIPLLMTRQERDRNRRTKVSWVIMALGLIVAAIVSIHLFYRPLDLLLHSLIQRIGI